MSLPTVDLRPVELPPAVVAPRAYRLRPVPPLEPAYDDETSPTVRPPLRLVVGAAPTLPFRELPEKEGSDRADPLFAAQPTSRRQLPDPARWTARLVQAIAEVMTGSRPLQQLMPWTDEGVYLQLTGRVRRHRQAGTAPARLCSVHVSEPRDGVAEACAVLRQGPRSRAVALRLEGFDGRWRCTALQIG